MSDLVKLLSGYCDERGYPGTIQADGTYDGGDSAAIIGTIKTLSDISVPPMYIAISSVTQCDQPLRHWDSSKWYGKRNRFSRDQLIPNICATVKRIDDSVKYNLPQGFDMLFFLHAKRTFLTAWNTINNDGSKKSWPASLGDICGPEVWALWIRAYPRWYLTWLLPIFDVQTLTGAIQWRWFMPQSNQITRNHMLVCITTHQYRPTWISRLANWVNNWPDLLARWKACNEATGEYPTWELFQTKLKELGLL